MEANDSLTTFICLFHSPARAESALQALEQAGIQRSTVSFRWNNATGENQENEARDLREIGVPERDLDRLEKGLADGGVVLSLDAPESRSDDIEGIFHRYSADKIDEADLKENAPAEPFLAAAPVAAAASSRVAEDAEAMTIPIAEEELIVGKRNVDRGGVRVYRHIVEESVSEPVQLHEEHVVLERHAVDRPVTPEDLRTGEGTLELIETAEVPVIQKSAHVVEEVHVGVVGSEHIERINDTVRHTEVDIEPVDAAESASTLRDTNDSFTNRKA